MDLLQTVTPEILAQVRKLIKSARHASLGVLEQATGAPFVSRVALATTGVCTPLLLTSALAPHTAALGADGRCSLLIGDLGKGDAMAHARITLSCVATRAPDANRTANRERFLAHHPKAINYIDLPDFGYWHLNILRASFNAGFGKAYAIEGQDLTSSSV